jgi:hypothetical protein
VALKIPAGATMIEAGHGEKILVGDIKFNSREREFKEGIIPHYKPTEQHKRSRSEAIHNNPSEAQKARERSLETLRQMQEIEDRKFAQIQQRSAISAIEERHEEIMQKMPSNKKSEFKSQRP